MIMWVETTRSPLLTTVDKKQAKRGRHLGEYMEDRILSTKAVVRVFFC